MSDCLVILLTVLMKLLINYTADFYKIICILFLNRSNWAPWKHSRWEERKSRKN